jgi:tRNA uridine 5-carboxymethylaminomethyl modification enzyme
LREDNAFERLGSLGVELGLVGPEQARHFEVRRTAVGSLSELARSSKVRIDADRLVSVAELLKRPELQWESFDLELPGLGDGDLEFLDLAIESLEIEAKYGGYLVRQQRELKALSEMREMRFTFNDGSILAAQGLSSEVKEKLLRVRPTSMRELAEISGVSPIAALEVARVLSEARAVSRETAL